jgi:hypothetical protein
MKRQYATSLVRIRFPYHLIDLLDRLAERLRVRGRRKIPRAAVVRALVEAHMSLAADDVNLSKILAADPVKRGREKGPQGPRQARV